MNSVRFKSENFSYDIFLDDSYNMLREIFVDKNLKNKKVCIITDDIVFGLHYRDIEHQLIDICYELSCYVIKNGEKRKNLDEVRNIYKFLTENNIDRDCIIVALGGGVIGDISGFVAATFMRGIKYIQIPTTLLSQLDSSIGGKVGIDFENSKNLIGSFYQPFFVYTNINTLLSLDDKQFCTGLSEAIKHALIADKDYYNFIKVNKNKILERDFNIVKKLILESCKIKLNIVSKDTYDIGYRNILNFGHTFGHAIEALSDFEHTHGQCITFGIICACKYSSYNGLLDEEDLMEIISLLKYFGFNLNVIFPTEDIISKMYKDKKSINTKLKVVVLNSIGDATIINVQHDKLIRECIEFAKNLY